MDVLFPVYTRLEKDITVSVFVMDVLFPVYTRLVYCQQFG